MSHINKEDVQKQLKLAAELLKLVTSWTPVAWDDKIPVLLEGLASNELMLTVIVFLLNKFDNDMEKAAQFLSDRVLGINS